MIRDVVNYIESKLADMGFATVDVDRGQADMLQPGLKYPAALVGVRGTEVTGALGGRSMRQMMRVQVRVLDMVLGSTNVQAPEEQRELWFRFADLLEAVFDELHLRARMVAMQYKGLEIITREDGLSEGVLSYNVDMGLIAEDSSDTMVVLAEVKKEMK